MLTRVFHPIVFLCIIPLFFSQCRPSAVKKASDEVETPEMAYARGKRLLDAGEYKRAGAEFERAGALDADYAPAYEGLSRVAFARGKRQEAIRQIRIAKRKDINYPPAWIFTGVLYASAGRYKYAITEYQGALERDPDRLWAKTTYYLLGEAYQHLDDLDRAEAAFVQAVALDPLYLEARASLEKLRQEKTERLRAIYRRASDPSNR